MRPQSWEDIRLVRAQGLGEATGLGGHKASQGSGLMQGSGLGEVTGLGGHKASQGRPGLVSNHKTPNPGIFLKDHKFLGHISHNLTGSSDMHCR